MICFSALKGEGPRAPAGQQQGSVHRVYEDKREMGEREEEMGRTSKERVMIYILSKLEYISTCLLQRSNVTVDSLQTRWGGFVQEFRPGPLMWPADSCKESERVYKQPRWAEEFPMTSLLMGCRDAVNQILSEASHTNTHRYDLISSTFQVSRYCSTKLLLQSH